ncbi:MAG: PAS domain-containing protein [Anaerolineae bacterium]|nr:PAS domain-containing protein [Anaerolineae bacterium]
MPLQFTPYIIPLLLAAFLAAGILIYTWIRRTTHGAVPFMFMMLGILHWLLAYAIGISHTSLSSTLFWANITLLGIVVVPVAWVLFCLEYTNRGHLITRRNVLLLLAEPAFITVAIWTNESHHLFRQTIFLETTGSFVALNATFGPLFWLHTAYCYGLLAYGTYLLLVTFLRASRLYRIQVGIMLAGAFIPWIANALYLLFLTPIILIDPTPIAFLLAGATVAWGMFGFGLMDIAPVARNWVIEQMDDGMIVLDNRNRVVDINPAAANLIQRTPNELIGQTGAHLFAQWPELVDRYRNVEKAATEIQLPMGTGIRHIYLNILPLHDRYQRLNGRLLVIRDITEQKEIQMALQIAKEKADAANQAKSTFLATMSHELRTPLAAIIGYSELIAEKSKLWGYEKIVPQLNQIGAAALHLNALIGNILDMSKIEAGRMEVFNSQFPVQPLIDDVLTTIQPLITQNSNTLELNLPPDLGQMYADRTKLHQILLNLLSNATKFTENGTITLEIQIVTDQMDGRKTYYFRISDTGKGIPEEKVSQLFQPFVQVDSSLTRKHGGSGLGLAISYKFCQLMGGNLRLESKLGQGTTLYLSLPATGAEPPESYT